MRIGEMNRLIKIERWTEVGRTPLNSPIMEWAPIAVEWAGMTYQRADEEFAANQRYESRVVTFVLYYVEGVTGADRIDLDGTLYDIKGVKEIGFREGLEISAELQI